MGLQVTAEGIENETQAKILRSYKCDQAQGFLYAHPLPPDDAQALINNGI
jgi:EAL domain-containing protein (putative c-di-GMP-specific phosphodiesterase class I)